MPYECYTRSSHQTTPCCLYWHEACATDGAVAVDTPSWNQSLITRHYLGRKQMGFDIRDALRRVTACHAPTLIIFLPFQPIFDWSDVQRNLS